ncbi:Cutinase [Pleurostoma richardsiae]|uniref:Cutinase n=1 Tax=Pleurostoma richardsiae TaxID=41990 RepID=A0AA38VPD4_9PEZI|nr:Cutinase [Pleurostoma richardsiae]
MGFAAAAALLLTLGLSAAPARALGTDLTEEQLASQRRAEAARDLAARAEGCDDVHIFLARGNNEPYPGRQRNIVNDICGKLDNCGYEDIYFTAGEEQVYCDTVHQGALNGQAQIINYAVRCPDSLLALSGYSQGAQIVGDILGGDGDATIFNCAVWTTTGLSVTSDVGERIKAAIIFGDVRHTAGQSYNVLDGADKDGLIPRSGSLLSSLNEWSDRLRSYCAAEDPICASGDNVTDHLNYFDLYSEQAAEWVISKLGVSTVATATAWALPTSISGKVEPYSGTSYTTTDHPTPSVTPDLDVVISSTAAASSSSSASSSASPSSSSALASSSASASSSGSSGRTNASSSATATLSTSGLTASSGVATTTSAVTSASAATGTTSAAASSSSSTSTSAAGRMAFNLIVGGGVAVAALVSVII